MSPEKKRRCSYEGEARTRNILVPAATADRSRAGTIGYWSAVVAMVGRILASIWELVSFWIFAPVPGLEWQAFYFYIRPLVGGRGKALSRIAKAALGIAFRIPGISALEEAFLKHKPEYGKNFIGPAGPEMTALDFWLDLFGRCVHYQEWGDIIDYGIELDKLIVFMKGCHFKECGVQLSDEECITFLMGVLLMKKRNESTLADDILFNGLNPDDDPAGIYVGAPVAVTGVAVAAVAVAPAAGV